MILLLLSCGQVKLYEEDAGTNYDFKKVKLWVFQLCSLFCVHRGKWQLLFLSSPLIISSDILRCGIQNSYSCPWDALDFSVVSTVDKAYRSGSGFGRLWCACPIKRRSIISSLDLLRRTVR